MGVGNAEERRGGARHGEAMDHMSPPIAFFRLLGQHCLREHVCQVFGFRVIRVVDFIAISVGELAVDQPLIVKRFGPLFWWRGGHALFRTSSWILLWQSQRSTDYSISMDERPA